MTVLTFVVVLCLAVLMGGIAFLIVPFLIGAGANAVGRKLTGQPLNLGCIGYIFVAIIGVIVGNALIGPIGPKIENIHIVPAFLGSVIVTIILSLLRNRKRPRQF